MEFTATINNIYIFVEDEEFSRDIDSTTHPVETGIEITSTIRNKPLEVSLQGKIVDVGDKTASEILSEIEELRKKGSLITYKGRNTAQNLQIQSFSTTHPYTNAGGADFSMSLKEIRIAKSSYTKSSSNKATSKKNNPDLSVGSIVVFKGGNVYVSSDATKAAANRGRSTCKITIINTRSWSKHSYHLISTDGKKVYGWVDKSNIEGVASDNTASTTNGGTQQPQKSSSGSGSNSKSKKIYHTVKKGETIISIVAAYKEYGVTAKTIMNNNPNAFLRSKDARTLIIGAKLFIANG